MPPMDRDKEGRCRKKSGPIAGQSLRRCEPPRTEVFSFRTTPERFERLLAMIAAGKYRSRADAIDDAVSLLSSLLLRTTLPSWVTLIGPGERQERETTT